MNSTGLLWPAQQVHDPFRFLEGKSQGLFTEDMLSPRGNALDQPVVRRWCRANIHEVDLFRCKHLFEIFI